jgi:phosphoserine phosphatase RsbU/P
VVNPEHFLAAMREQRFDPTPNMKILIAEDDTVSGLTLEGALKAKGHECTNVTDGRQAWTTLQHSPFSVLITDYRMPEMDGFELARRIRAANRPDYTYIILLTAQSSRANYLEAIQAGVDDFLSKPFDPDLLHARLHVAERIVNLRQHVKRLEGLLPICASCKKIRDAQDAWHPIEVYIARHSEAKFTHGLCPACAAKFLSDAGMDPTGLTKRDRS